MGLSGNIADAKNISFVAGFECPAGLERSISL
jgi:hypothetical protein